MCGYGEFTDVTVPPRYYRTKTYGGSGTSQVYGVGSNCTGSVAQTITCVNSGSCSYNATTCVVTNNTQQFCNGVFNTGGFCSDIIASCGRAVALTKTTLLTSAINECCGAQIKVTSDAFTETLTNEDTEADALTRLLATVTFPAYAPCATPATCCKADYQSRTSTTFNYHEAQYKVYATVTPSTFFYSNVYLYRRPYGTVTWTAYGMNVESGTSSVTGFYITSGTAVNNTRGYETYAGPAYIVP